MKKWILYFASNWGKGPTVQKAKLENKAKVLFHECNQKLVEYVKHTTKRSNRD